MNIFYAFPWYLSYNKVTGGNKGKKILPVFNKARCLEG